jgi:polyhydroxyalkanoate synthase
MHRSRNRPGDLLPEHRAVQHERAPRPLPLFLALVREVSTRDPELARQALAGLKAYELADRDAALPGKPEAARVGGTCLRDHGGDGPPVVLIPSLINPPRILDLDREASLTGAVKLMGRQVLLLDWGPAEDRAQLSVGEHVEQLLMPLLHDLGQPVALVGYCLGGTMAIAAANLAECERVATLAAPWNFSLYPEDSRAALGDMWRHSEPAAQSLGALPMEVLQAAFWSLDPERTVRKFARFGGLDPASAEARRFVTLEDWANEGESLPYPAARELIVDLFGRDVSGTEQWKIGDRVITDRLSVPLLNILAAEDRIAPAATAPAGDALAIPSGHVGMIVGSARARLHDTLRVFLSARAG